MGDGVEPLRPLLMWCLGRCAGLCSDDSPGLFFFATNFAILFYQTNTWTATPFKLEARKD